MTMADNENIEDVDTDVTEEVAVEEKPAKKAAPKRAPKKPQDRKPKAVKAPATAKTEADEDGKMSITVKDIDLVVDADVLEDFEVMEHIMAVDMGDQHSIIHAGQGLRMILGLEQHAMVMEKLRDKNGRAPIGDVLQFFIELIQAFYPNS